MGTRIDLQAILELLLGSNEVYFQPPESVKMNYPAIVYERIDVDAKFADNILYLHKKKYKVTIIDRDPDSLIPDILAKVTLCSFDRHFTTSNLNHDVYNLYY